MLIEGVDRTGKTSLAKKLAAEMGRAEVVHASAPRSGDPIEEYLGPLRDYDGRRNVILDRGYLGEAIWPYFFGRESIMSTVQQITIERRLRELGCLLVLALRSESGLRLEFERADPPEPLPVEKVIAAQQLFRVHYSRSRLEKIPYDHQLRGSLVPGILGLSRLLSPGGILQRC